MNNDGWETAIATGIACFDVYGITCFYDSPYNHVAIVYARRARTSSSTACLADCGRVCVCARRSNLAYNNLTGALPASLGFLVDLVYLCAHCVACLRRAHALTLRVVCAQEH